jgi:hypoxanthine phosphoribosyltransferase
MGVCALLDKRARRLVDVPLDYVGFEVPDEFVVGYGLDYRQVYRNLPFIATLQKEWMEDGPWEMPGIVRAKKKTSRRRTKSGPK